MKKAAASVYIGQPQTPQQASVFIGQQQQQPAAGSVFIGAACGAPAAANKSVTLGNKSISKAPAPLTGSIIKPPEGSVVAGTGSMSKAPAAVSSSQSGKAPAAASSSQSGKAPAAASSSQSGKAPAAASASQSGKASAAASASQSGKAPAAASASQTGKAPAAASASQSGKAPAAASSSQVGKAPAAASASQTGKAPVAAGTSQVSAMPMAATGSMAAKAPDDVISQVEAAYKTLQAATDCKSLLKKCFTEQVKDVLKARKTKMGATLIDVIQSGVKNLDSGVGIYAPDAESYTTFKELFDPVCEAYHGFKATDKQPPVDLGESHIAELVNLDPENKYIVSTRIRCGRSIQGYQFNPCLTEANYKEMESKMQEIFKNIPDSELQGTYYPLTGMTKEVQNQLIKDHFLFKEGDRYLQAANACRYWPNGRGIFHNKDKTFLVWVNEEDHLRIISMQPGGDVGKVLDRLIRGVRIIEKQMPFSRDDRLGWLTFCPTNLGTTIRASVHVKIPKTSAKPEFKSICDEMKLQIRGIHGEHSETEGGVYDISNKRRLGFSEYEVIKQMYYGVKKLLKLEKAG